VRLGRFKDSGKAHTGATMGRDQSPNAGRKAEAGSQAGRPQLQVAANFASGCWRERRPERRAGSGGQSS
jgi:hypothetical protein